MGAAILHDLVVVMVVAAAVTILFYKLRQPVVLGYLAAGVIIGPYSSRLSLVHDPTSIEALAELGIVFLMFAVGLEFNLQKLRRVGPAAAIVAALQVGIMIVLGYATGRALGWSPIDSVFLGAIVSISSTVIIVKVLSEMGQLKEGYTEIVIGVLVIEDLAAILLVSVLSTMGATGVFDAGVLAGALGGILLFVFIFIAVGLVLVPRLIDVVSKFHVEEVLVITVVGLAFGAGMLALEVGFSLSLGAFLMGAIVAESRAVRRVGDKIAPVRDLFVAIFFVAVGMLVDPRILLPYAVPILLVTLVTIVGKIVAVSVSAFLLGYDGRTSLKVGSTMGQIGEFSFVIAAVGLSLGVVRPELHGIAVVACALTSLATPWTIRVGPALADALAPRTPAWLARATMAYTRGVRRLRARRPDALGRPDKHRARHGTRVAIYAAWLFGLLIVAAYVSAWLGAEVGEALSLEENSTRAAAVGFLSLGALPLLVAFTKATEAWSLAGAKQRAMRPDRLGRPQAQHAHPQRVARISAAVATVLILAAAVWIAWGVHPLAVPSTWLLVPVLAVVALVGRLTWRRLERVYHGMEATLNELMGEDAPDPHHPLRERLPWGMDVMEVPVGAQSRAAYTSLKNMRLRDQTGATLLTVERRTSAIANPHPDTVLLPGDRLILVGKRDQLDQASAFLQGAIPRAFPVAPRARPQAEARATRSEAAAVAPHPRPALARAQTARRAPAPRAGRRAAAGPRSARRGPG